jgi:hypothetical protein
MTDIASTICNGVAATSWPIGIRVMESALHLLTGRSRPADSPWPSNSPVRWPMPKARAYL